MADLWFLPGAEEDYRSAYGWYHDRGEHLADAFELAVDQALRQIADAPLRFGKYDGRHRCHLVRRFPYSVIYRVEEQRVVVVAVAHAKRRPGYWEDRDE